jgi:peroxiredoxin
MAEPCSTSAASPIARLQDAAVPPTRFRCYARTPVAVPELGEKLVLYLYPGSICSPEDGYQSPSRDSLQHRSFADRRGELGRLRYNAVGLSSQSVDALRRVAADTGVSHPLLSDPDLQLARALGLPTFNMDHTDWYCRLTLVVDRGRVAAAFYPTSAARSGGEAVAWIRKQEEQDAARGA